MYLSPTLDYSCRVTALVVRVTRTGTVSKANVTNWVCPAICIGILIFADQVYRRRGELHWDFASATAGRYMYHHWYPYNNPR